MAKRAELEPLIRQAWLNRPPERRNGNDVLVFHGELSKNRPELLGFRASGDKYQVLKSILRGLVNEEL